jgi:hypothetical protein
LRSSGLSTFSGDFGVTGGSGFWVCLGGVTG